MRFFAALWVLTMHLETRAPLEWSGPARRLIENGGYAMTLFFVLSGTVLAYGYHALRPVKEDVIAFYQARFARIYPAYIVLHLIALVWIAPANAKQLTEAIYDNALSALGLQAWCPSALLSGANSSTWSISVEFFFYALFPAVLPLVGYLRTRWGGLRVAAYLSALSGFIGLADYAHINGWLYYWMPAARLPEFMLGLVIGLALLEAPRGTRHGGLTLALSFVTSLAAVLNPAKDYGVWIRANFVVVPALGWFIYELARWNQAHPPARSVLWRGFVYLGESSYCLFLAQLVPLLFLYTRTGTGWRRMDWHEAPGPVWGFTLAATLVCTLLLHEGVEKPVRRYLLRRWSTPLRDRPAATWRDHASP
jgi:peptidoglycan/LPS O-acetylase OafA/YrhL